MRMLRVVRWVKHQVVCHHPYAPRQRGAKAQARYRGREKGQEQLNHCDNELTLLPPAPHLLPNNGDGNTFICHPQT